MYVEIECSNNLKESVPPAPRLQELQGKQN